MKYHPGPQAEHHAFEIGTTEREANHRTPASNILLADRESGDRQKSQGRGKQSEDVWWVQLFPALKAIQESRFYPYLHRSNPARQDNHTTQQCTFGSISCLGLQDKLKDSCLHNHLVEW